MFFFFDRSTSKMIGTPIEAYIAYHYKKRILFKIGKLTYRLFDNDDFEYEIEIYPDVLNVLKDVEIPGLNINKMIENKYVWLNKVPVFIQDRILPRNRVNLHEEIKRDYPHAKGYTPLSILIDSPKQYSGDLLSLRSEFAFDQILNEQAKNGNPNSESIYTNITMILKIIAARGNLKINSDEIVTNDNRAQFLTTFMYLYEQVISYYRDKSANSPALVRVGKTNNEICEIVNLWSHGIISEEEALTRAQMSRSTFYRRLKEIRTK